MAEGGVGMAGMPYPPTIARLVQQGLLHPLRGRHGRGLGFSPKPTLQPHFEYWVADDKLAWGIGGDKVFLCERFLQTCDIGSGAKTVFF